MPTYTYRYQPLKGPGSIRLLILLPTLEDSDQLRCSLQQTDLKSSLRYEALSYVWGDSEPSRSIFCSGAPVSIRENLYQALRQLRTPSPRVLWVDAVCINQGDIQEKSKQIQLMREIYNGASTVLSWLGENGVHERPGLGSLRSSALTAKNQVPSDGIKYDSYLPYLDNPYWTRVWTFQESILSRQQIFKLDHAELDWEIFWDHIWSEIEQLPLCSKQQLSPASHQALQFYSLVASTSAIKLLLKDPTLSSLDPTLSYVAWAEFQRTVEFAKGLHCSDPRDTVYSFLGLAQTLGVELPLPDYSKPTALVFQEARATLLKKTITTAMVVTEKSTFHEWRVENGRYRLRLKEASLIYPRKWSTHLSRGLSPDKSRQDNPRHLTILTKYPFFESSTKLPSLAFPQYIQDMKAEALHEDSDSEDTMPFEAISEITAILRSCFGQVIMEQGRHLFEYVLTHLKRQPMPVSCHGGQGASNNTSLDHPEWNRNEAQSKGVSKNGTNDLGDDGTTSRRKRIGDDDDSEDDPEGPPRKQMKQRTVVDLPERVACPYFQRNSQAPRLHAACRGPGFPNVHRLKEHLYRTHHIHLCDRCGDGFNSRALLTGHLRSPQVCQTKDWRATFDRNGGFEDSQRDALKRRGVKTWNQIFKILFPEDNEDFYPPQHHCNEQFVQFLDRFRVHYSRETQKLVPQRLLNAPFISALNSQQLDTIRDDISRFVTELHNEIVQTFRTQMLREAVAEVTAQPADPGLPVESVNIPNPHAIMLDLFDEMDPTRAMDPSLLPLPYADDSWDALIASAPFPLAPLTADHGQSGMGHSPSLPGMGAHTASFPDRQSDARDEAGHYNNADETGSTSQGWEKDTWTVVNHEFE